MKPCPKCGVNHTRTDDASCWKAMKDEIEWLTWHIMAYNPQIIENRIRRF